jgi:ribosomal protein S12 methylthiotransferase
MEQQQQISAEINADQVGTTVEILLENKISKNQWQGRTYRQAPEVDGITTINNLPESAEKGTFIKAKITGSENYDQTAECI